MPQEQARRLRFGPFEVDADAQELLRAGRRFRLSGHPFGILLVLLEHPGELVTRDHLRERIWPDGTFVDFEHGLNAAINKLRRALGDSAGRPQFIETVPGRGYRFIGALTRVSPAVAAIPLMTAATAGASGRETAPGRRRLVSWTSLASVGACLLVLWGHTRKSHDSSVPWKLVRLTADSGLSESPAISRDGTLVAYSSDRSGEGQRDLYVQQVAGDQPIQLTFDGKGNRTPDFSPDGSKIVFRSDRDGGGIYEIPSFGGQIHLLAREGLNPRFSPDGSRIAYWIRDPDVASAVPGSGSVWVIAEAGGQPEQVSQNFTAARIPVWSPDSQHLLFVGYTSSRAYDPAALDWWLVSADGENRKRTGAYAMLADAQSRRSLGSFVFAYGLPAIPYPSCWTAASNIVIFSVLSGEALGLWQMPIAPWTGQATEAIERLTTGAGQEEEPSCANEHLLAFTSLDVQRNVWSVPFDLNNGKATGRLERRTQTPARQECGTLSADGRVMAFSSAEAGHNEGRFRIFVRELATGRQSMVTNSLLIQRFPVLNASGSRIAFSMLEDQGRRSVYVSTVGGRPEKVCEGCLRATDWSRDNKTLLVFGGAPYQISTLDLGSYTLTRILQHPTYNLLYARFSPDNQWVSFTVRTQPNHARLMIAPLDGPHPLPESSWIQVAEGAPEDWANWSPDGQTLYFSSARDGHMCFWGQRLDPQSHRPIGEEFPAQHLHGRVTYQQGGWSIGGGQLAMVATEDRGNIWIMSRDAAPRNSGRDQ